MDSLESILFSFKKIKLQLSFLKTISLVLIFLILITFYSLSNSKWIKTPQSVNFKLTLLEQFLNLSEEKKLSEFLSKQGLRLHKINHWKNWKKDGLLIGAPSLALNQDLPEKVFIEDLHQLHFFPIQYGTIGFLSNLSSIKNQSSTLVGIEDPIGSNIGTLYYLSNLPYPSTYLLISSWTKGYALYTKGIVQSLLTTDTSLLANQKITNEQFHPLGIAWLEGLLYNESFSTTSSIELSPIKRQIIQSIIDFSKKEQWASNHYLREGFEPKGLKVFGKVPSQFHKLAEIEKKAFRLKIAPLAPLILSPYEITFQKIQLFFKDSNLF